MTNLAQKEILIEVELDELLENPWTYFDCNLLVNGKEVRISVDEFAENPLEWDFNPTLLSLLRRYNIGVKTIIDKNGEKEFSVPDDFESIDDIEAFLSKNDYVYKKVYAYIHSNISLALEGNCSPLLIAPLIAVWQVSYLLVKPILESGMELIELQKNSKIKYFIIGIFLSMR